MTQKEFAAALADPKPPENLHPILTALWHDANGNWEAAHGIAQAQEGKREFDRLHAYLHRKQGDAGNAAYWYRRAGADVYTGTLQQEWNELAGQWLD